MYKVSKKLNYAIKYTYSTKFQVWYVIVSVKDTKPLLNTTVKSLYFPKVAHLMVSPNKSSAVLKSGLSKYKER